MKLRTWIIIGVAATAAYHLSNLPNAEKETERQPPLDYSSPIFTKDRTIVCPQSLFFDIRADHGPEAVYSLFTSIVSVDSKAKALGCELWRGGLSVYAHRMSPPFDDFVSVSFSRDAASLFTMEPHLTNNFSPAEIENRKGNAAFDQKDYAQAMQWYLRAARQGHPNSAHNIGILYQEGWGVPQDYLAASNWYKQAANAGFAPSQYNLGVLYESGLGVDADFGEALKLYGLAAAQGDDDARIALADINSRRRDVSGNLRLQSPPAKPPDSTSAHSRPLNLLKP